MKILLLFIVFFLIGLAVVLGYRYWNQQIIDFRSTIPAITTKFSLENAPSDSERGTIATMSGTVSWLSRTGANSVKLTAPREIQQGEVLGTGSNGKVVVRIQNDASLFLFPNSQVNIIQLLPQNFVFVQNQGTIRYENTIQVPVSIRTGDLLTVITKGIVTIVVDSIGKTVSVAVSQGVVKEGFEDSQGNSTVADVSPGETFVFDDTAKQGVIQ